MKSSNVACLLSACALPGLFSLFEAIRFQPEAGTRLTKTFRTELACSLDEMSATLDGGEIPPEFLPDMDIEFSSEELVVVTDDYLELGDGLPVRLRRTYDELAGRYASCFTIPPNPEESDDRASESDLEGWTVTFEWDEDAGIHDVSFDEPGGPEALLEGLAEDMDLRGLLPGDDVDTVEPGASWSLGGEVVDSLFSPGGQLGLESGREASADARLEGELTARFTGWDESGGARLAVIALEGRVEQVTEVQTDLQRVPIVDGDATEVKTTVFDVAGELRWNTETNHLAHLLLTSPVELEVVLTKNAGQPGPDFESVLLFSGTWSFEVGVESAP
ncbi:MAG: hypothetical protein O7B99_05010 [Planctomycetota bacterium]|nr:hypothetical protein [Planctomycetota bacterium]